MSAKFTKSAQQLATLITFWYLKHQDKQLAEVTGQEGFTLFDKIPQTEKEAILKSVTLNRFELPVLITRVKEDSWIVNTTESFIRIDERKAERIRYTDFSFHHGFRRDGITQEDLRAIDPQTGQERFAPKMEGRIMPFGLRLLNHEVIYWPMPTGQTMYGFWNVTKKCALLGRKYEIEEYKQ